MRTAIKITLLLVALMIAENIIYFNITGKILINSLDLAAFSPIFIYGLFDTIQELKKL